MHESKSNGAMLSQLPGLGSPVEDRGRTELLMMGGMIMTMINAE
jgi:hypothetical protein